MKFARASIRMGNSRVSDLNTAPGLPIFPLRIEIHRQEAGGSNYMMILRTLGVWSLLVAMVALTIDGTQSLASGEGQWIITPLGEHWFKLHAASLNMAQAAVERHVVPWLWDPVILSVLQVPTWVFFGVLGLMLYWLGQRRRSLDVYEN